MLQNDVLARIRERLEQERASLQSDMTTLQIDNQGPQDDEGAGNHIADEASEVLHPTGAGDQAKSLFELAEDCRLACSEAHVAGQRDLATIARCPAADQRNRGNWRSS